MSWLNNDVKMVHGNLTGASLFMTRSGDWKLGGFDILFAHGEAANSELIRSHRNIVPLAFRCPELASDKGDAGATIERSPPWAVDAWGLGCLIFELFNETLDRPQQLTQVGKIPAALHKDYKRLLATAPGSRLNPAKLLECPLFDNELVQVGQLS